MNHFITCALSLLLLGIPAGASSVKQVDSCQQLFASSIIVGSRHGELEEGASVRELKKLSPEQRSSEMAQVSGSTKSGWNHEGNLRVLKSTSGLWHSFFRPEIESRAIAGNPQWFVSIFGSKAAYEFGFRSIDASHMTAPDAEAMNAVIDKVNHEVESTPMRFQDFAKISVRFYETDIAKPITATEFLKRFINDQLPLEKNGSIAVHDLSYHAPSVMLPKWVFEPLQDSSKLVLQLVSSLREKDREKYKGIIRSLLRRQSEQVDDIGVMTRAIASFSRELKDPSSRRQSIMRGLGFSEKAQLKEMLTEDLKRIGADKNPVENVRSILRSNGADADVLAVFDRMGSEWEASLPSFSRATAIKPPTLKAQVNELIKDLTARISEIGTLAIRQHN